MRRSASLFVALALAAVASFAQSFTPPAGLGGGPAIPSRQEQLVKLEVRFDKATYAANDSVSGEVIATVEPTWHINSAKPLDDYAIPTTLDISSPALTVEGVRWPAHEELALGFAGGKKVAVYQGAVRIPFSAKRTAATDESVLVKLHYQACNDSVCLPPRDVETSVRLGASVGSVPQSGGGFTPLSAAPSGADQKASLLSGDIGAIFHSRGLLLTLLAVFVVGLALNLTPCVYPLIPITLAFFASQTAGKKSRQIALASAYVGGLAAMYAALGVIAAMSGSLFGAWLQSPWVLGFFVVLMLVLAASMFGAFEIRVPHFISDRSGAKSGYAGAAVMGLFAGIVAAPCVGPVVVSLIALVSQLKDPLVGTLMFVVLAIGLGFPYLIGLSSLPRSGAWMVTVKKALGFILIAMAFYFLRPVAGELVYRWGVAVSLLLGALFLFAFRKSAGAGKALSFSLAVILLLGGFAFAPKGGKHEGMSWQPYSPAALAAAKAAGKPVIIDFYADWCIPCKELDEKTFSAAPVIAASGDFVRLKADLTRTADEETKKLSEEFSIIGVPTIVFVGKDGRERSDLRLTGFEPPEKFVKRLEPLR